MSGYSWPVPESVSAGAPGSDDDKALVLARDIFFDGDFRVTPAGDWLTIEGEEAVRQAIYRRLVTSPGEYVAFPDYGCGVAASVKEEFTDATLKELQTRIKQNLLLDRRIEQVSCTVTEKAYGIEVRVAVRIAGRELTFTPFEFSR